MWAIGLGGFVLAALGAVAGWAIRINTGERADASAKRAHERIDELAKEVGDFKAEVAANYVSNRTLDQMERRVVDAINRLGDRLDNVFTKWPARRSTRSET